MHRPMFAFDAILDLFARREHMSGEPELLCLWGLQVVPDDLAICAEELVSGDLHIHLASMYLLQLSAIRVDGPDTIELVPWAFVAKHEELRVCGRELDMVQPIRG